MAGDITDPFGTARALDGCEIVFHLAALIAIPYSYIAPAQFVAVNCGGTLNLLEAARQQGVERFVHTSTSEVYGTAQYAPIDENHPLQGQSPYAASKIGADKLVESFYRTFGVPAVTVRPFNTYGPRQSARAVIPTIITQALGGRFSGWATWTRGGISPTSAIPWLVFSWQPGLRGWRERCSTWAAGVPGVTIGELADKIVDLLGGGKRNRGRGRAGAPRRQRGHGTPLQLRQGSWSAWLGTQGQPGGGPEPHSGLYPGASAPL